MPQPADSIPALSLPPEYKPFRVPDPPAIPQPLTFTRAFRPLARRIAVGVPTELDESETVDQIADTGVWQPVMKPKTELWLDVALIFDTSPSMSLWQRYRSDLQKLLSHYGEFRDLQVWELHHNGKVDLTSVNGNIHNPHELLVGDRRRVVMIVSDCVANAWHDGRMRQLVSIWSAKLPTVIIQVFPERLWSRTALARAVKVELQSQPGSGPSETPNPSNTLHPIARSYWDRSRLNADVRLPVLTIKLEAIADWVSVVLGDRRRRVPGIVWDEPVQRSEPLSDANKSTEQVTPAERADAFLLTASPMARELAGLLASAPVITLPIVRLIQRAMLPDSEAVHVAEVFMGGLLKVSGPQKRTEKHAEQIVYQLINEDVRKRLLSGFPATDGLIVLERVSKYVAKSFRITIQEFNALLRTPSNAKVPEKFEFLNAFAKVTASILRELGPEFVKFANSLALPEAESSIKDPIDFPLQDLEYEVAKLESRLIRQPCEYESATIIGIEERFEFETAKIARETDSKTSNEEWVINRRRAATWGYTEDLGNGISLDMMAIPGGTFTMGAPKSEPESTDDERPQHEVSLQPFYLGCCAITQAQWRTVAGYSRIDRDLKPEPSSFKGDKRPVDSVSWEDAQEFCQRLSAKTGKDYRLPSEAQWEYACRSGSETPFHYGETISTDLVNYDGDYTYNDGPKGKYREKTTEVGSFPGNDWGLHDMHGNVWEWCEDDWHDSYEGAPSDGSAWVESERLRTRRVLRGGSWNNNPANCRSAVRNNNTRDNINNNVGFRVSCEPPSTLHGQSWLVGISREYKEESRLAPAMREHPKIPSGWIAW